jgi:hypothetical protein
MPATSTKSSIVGAAGVNRIDRRRMVRGVLGMIPPYRVKPIEANDNVPFAEDVRLAA